MDYTPNLTDSLSISEGILTKCGDKVYLEMLQENGEPILQESGDTILLEDQYYFVFDEELYDVVSILESLANTATLRISDSQLILESLDSIGVGKELLESQGISESLTKGVVIKPSDFVSLVESLANKTTLRVSDSQLISESILTINDFYFNLVLVDSVDLDAEITTAYFIVRKGDTAFVRSNIY